MTHISVCTPNWVNLLPIFQFVHQIWFIYETYFSLYTKSGSYMIHISVSMKNKAVVFGPPHVLRHYNNCLYYQKGCVWPIFQFAGLEAILTSILDQFPNLRPHKTKIILAMCIVFFLLGLPLCTQVSKSLLSAISICYIAVQL